MVFKKKSEYEVGNRVFEYLFSAVKTLSFGNRTEVECGLLFCNIHYKSNGEGMLIELEKGEWSEWVKKVEELLMKDAWS